MSNSRSLYGGEKFFPPHTMRPTWKGSINFGLVFIPVSVYPATKEEKISFKQLRATDLSPIRYKKVAEVDQKEVPSAEIVKGYEYAKGQWVTLKDEDFEHVKIESTKSVEITDFVDQSQINPKFFYKPYFLEAQKGGEKAYALLHKALTETNKVGVAKVAIQSREYLAAVKPDGLFLIMELMHFAHEVLEPENLKSADETVVSAKELTMAKALIEAMTTEWDPTKYSDQYQTAVMEMIQAKVNNIPLKSATQLGRAPSNVIDLVAILRESLAKAGGTKKPSTKEAPKQGKTGSPPKKQASGSKNKVSA